MGDMRRVLGLAKTLVQHQRYLSSDGSSVLELPVYGNLCLQVHNGHKVFDLRRNVVVKVFSHEIDLATVRSEIERVRSVGRYDFAPSVRRWNVEERWYEEDYVNGYHAKYWNWTIFLRTFQQWLTPLIERMILVFPPQVVNAVEYSCERRNILVGEGSKLSDGRLDADKVGIIRAFVDSMIERLRMAGNRQIHLVFSHGDFSPSPVLITNHGAVIIDWETVGHRSVLFDLYNAFLQQLYLGHAVPDIVVEMNGAISSLQSHLALRAPGIASELLPLLPSADIYRWLYYIERVCRIVEAHIKITDGLLDTILRWIGAFNRYEEILANGADQSIQPYQA